MIKGFKVFNPDWTCRGFQYEVGKTYTEDVMPECCSIGFHFCTKAIDCFNYYAFKPNNKVAEVEALGDIDTESDDSNSKCCTNKIRIIRELSWHEVLDIVNTGKGNTGLGNTGAGNSGYWNSGNYNSGSCNSGNCNSGNYNSGDWNKISYSNGCFNTKISEILLFNKPSNWTHYDWSCSDASMILNTCPCDIESTNAKRQEWWDKLSDKQKNIIKAIPNFDAEIFKEITGIEI